MEIAHHREKMARINDLRERLDPLDDFELWMWASMSAATNAMNAMLHKLGVTQPGTHFPHQIPGIFVEPEPAKGRWKKVIVPPGDLIHIGYPPIRTPIPETLSTFLTALEVIEGFRESHVRGNEQVDASVVEACDSAYRRCMEETAAVLEDGEGNRA